MELPALGGSPERRPVTGISILLAVQVKRASLLLLALKPTTSWRSVFGHCTRAQVANELLEMQYPPNRLNTIQHTQDLERFTELVLADPALHEQLRNTQPNGTAFITLAIRLAAERGCQLTEPMLREAINRKRREWLERWL